jgi:hypothetical protein
MPDVPIIGSNSYNFGKLSYSSLRAIYRGSTPEEETHE